MIVLYEWLAQLSFQKKNFQGGDPDQWTLELIQQLRKVNNKYLRVFKVWIEKNLEGYVTKFIVDTVKSYNDFEREFFKGPTGRLLLSLQLWIKMLICEKGILKINFDE